jgi:hypothetical protein
MGDDRGIVEQGCQLGSDPIGYLEDLPLVIAYVREVSASYAGEIPELEAFQDWFEARLMPLVMERGWSWAS